MKRVKHQIVHVILFFYLFSSYLGAAHIHKEVFASHNDCKICLVVKNINNADIPSAVHLPLCHQTFFEYVLLRQNMPVFQIEKGFDAQAPPSLF